MSASCRRLVNMLVLFAYKVLTPWCEYFFYKSIFIFSLGIIEKSVKTHTIYKLFSQIYFNGMVKYEYEKE